MKTSPLRTGLLEVQNTADDALRRNLRLHAGHVERQILWSFSTTDWPRRPPKPARDPIFEGEKFLPLGGGFLHERSHVPASTAGSLIPRDLLVPRRYIAAPIFANKNLLTSRVAFHRALDPCFHGFLLRLRLSSASLRCTPLVDSVPARLRPAALHSWTRFQRVFGVDHVRHV